MTTSSIAQSAPSHDQSSTPRAYRTDDPAGAERLIEVKTTNGGAKTPFFLTRNEKALSDERPEAFRLYWVFEFAHAPRLFTLEAPLERALVLDVGTWRAGFG